MLVITRMLNKEVVELAKADFAKRRGIPAGKIFVKLAETVDWPDASLGCPQKGRSYAQIITSGYRLVLSDGTIDLEYHTDSRARVTCYKTKI